jgi:16S rRNA C967 or C1407 C5-methylase (RsmB/RsmF family)
VRSLPNAALRLAARLFPEDAAEAERFLTALRQPSRGGHTIAWLRQRTALPFDTLAPFSWQPHFVDRVEGDAGAGRHPLHEAGAYYCLDSSSVFAASVLSAVPTQPSLVVDLCAAPGGKSLLAQRILQPAHLLSNEVVGKRVPALLQNLRRCAIQPATVCSLEPQLLADLLPQTAQVVIVDAPCSGQSLIARGKDALGCFNPSIITMNAQRQRRILAQAQALVAPGGHLAYITCTYAEKENEANLAWMLKRFPDFTPLAVPQLAEHTSHLTSTPCYRLWPHNAQGAGSFAALLQRSGTAPHSTENIAHLLQKLPHVWEVDIDESRTGTQNNDQTTD